MASRVVVLAIALLVCAIGVTTASARQPPTGTAMYVVRHDQRLCPSPMCGGYWVAIANGARTHCQDGLRRVRCYVARAVDRNGAPISSLIEESLVRGSLDSGHDRLGVLAVRAAYPPTGRAAASGGFYRVVDTGTRCVRAPCFSFRATQVNGATKIAVSSVDLAASGASANEVARAATALGTKDGLYARGRFARTEDGGTVFRALRLYLRAPLPRA